MPVDMQTIEKQTEDNLHDMHCYQNTNSHVYYYLYARGELERCNRRERVKKYQCKKCMKD